MPSSFASFSRLCGSVPDHEGGEETRPLIGEERDPKDRGEGPARTVITGHGDRLTTREATLPIRRREGPRRPWVPMTIRSAFSFSAASRISSSASPSRNSP